MSPALSLENSSLLAYADLLTSGEREIPMQTVRKFLGQHWPIILLILINIAIGLVVLRDYGQSWDEPGNYKYAYHSLDNYYNFFHGLPVTDFNELNLDQKGPAFFMLAGLFSRLVTTLLPGWLEINGWHLASFLTFQMGVISLYFLVRRWTGNWAAFGAALLFSTQPLFWGHAFINPKDIPFMSFFLLSLTLGLWMVDRLFAPGQNEGIVYSAFPVRQFQEEWKKASLVRRIAAFTPVLLWGVLGAVALTSTQAINNNLAAFIGTIYHADAQSFWGRLFARIAPNAGNIAVENYIAKAQSIFSKWEAALFIIAGLLLAVVFLRIVSRSSFSWLTKEILKPAGKAGLHYLRSPALLFAAVALGLTTAMRLSAPYVAVLVGLYALTKKGKKPLLVFIPYGVVAMLTAYFAWPYLWRDPIGRFIESMRVMSDYSGQSLSVSRFILPQLISIQLTEPVIILFLAGIVLAILNFNKNKFHEPFLLMVFWFLLPVAIAVATQSSLYDNFRQLFFLLPAVFIMVAVALDVLFAKLDRVWLNLALILVLAAPGIYAGVRLHPYEYIYFNSFVGGVKGAFRHYELDYWATSYKEAAEYLNGAAPANAKIGVVGTDLIFKPYARPDLKVYYFNGVDAGEDFDYVVINSRANNDLAICPRAKVVKTIERDGAVLAVIKQVSSREDCILSP
jgi:hypothetical protein